MRDHTVPRQAPVSCVPGMDSAARLALSGTAAIHSARTTDDSWAGAGSAAAGAAAARSEPTMRTATSAGPVW